MEFHIRKMLKAKKCDADDCEIRENDE